MADRAISHQINTLKDRRVVIRNDLRTAYEHREVLKDNYDQAVAFLNNPGLLAAPWQAQVYQQRGDIFQRRLREADIRIESTSSSANSWRSIKGWL